MGKEMPLLSSGGGKRSPSKRELKRMENSLWRNGI
jgi:hypothetical protein